MRDRGIKEILAAVKERLVALERRVAELEKENALMMRALAKLAEDKAEELGIKVPGAKPESPPS